MPGTTHTHPAPSNRPWRQRPGWRGAVRLPDDRVGRRVLAEVDAGLLHRDLLLRR